MPKLSNPFAGNWDFIRVEKWLFGLLLFIYIFPVWQNTYFLTGDGPTHSYNAKILKDYAFGEHVDFYNEYYHLNKNPEPNWFSHICLAVLQVFAPAWIAEKILITLYLLLFAGGIRVFIKSVNAEGLFFSCLILPFAFQKTMQMGFYNYSISIALFFWVTAYWLKHRRQFTSKSVAILGLLTLLLYFAHPVGLVLAWMLIGLVGLTELIVKIKAKELLFDFWKMVGKTALSAIPAAFLIFHFLFRKGLNATPNPYTFEKLWLDFIHLKSLTVLLHSEKYWSIAIAIVIALLLVIALIQKIRFRKFSAKDGLFLFFIATLLIYFFQPGELAGAGILSIRFLFLPYLAVLLWLSSQSFYKKIRWPLLVVFFLLGGIIMVIRYPIYNRISQAAEEYMSVQDYIESESTVLPLPYQHTGFRADNGEPITNQIPLFLHAADYLGTVKPLIMLSNYEAIHDWFPVMFHPEKNPYRHISKADPGLENIPPGVNVLDYQEKGGGTVDYILLWCKSPDAWYKDFPATLDVEAQLEEAYEKVFTSKNGFAELYKLK